MKIRHDYLESSALQQTQRFRTVVAFAYLISPVFEKETKQITFALVIVGDEYLRVHLLILMAPVRNVSESTIVPATHDSVGRLKAAIRADHRILHRATIHAAKCIVPVSILAFEQIDETIRNEISAATPATHPS